MMNWLIIMYTLDILHKGNKHYFIYLFYYQVIYTTIIYFWPQLHNLF